jgi:hypothetical protein
MADANLYSMDGKYSFYQNGKHFYSADNNECVFYQQGDYFYSMKDGQTLFYQKGKYLYSMDAVTKYYFS